MGTIRSCRRQLGCVRFCYVPPGSRTPRRYECQPDLVVQAVMDRYARGELTARERDTMLEREQLRVEPDFNSTRYGTPTYCQLATTCAEEIVRGADDESELGVFHDLYQPQRAAKAHLLLHGASGVPQRYYAAFANWASEQGLGVLTYDYRDFGESQHRPLHQSNANFAHWVIHDQAAAEARLAALAPRALSGS